MTEHQLEEAASETRDRLLVPAPPGHASLTGVEYRDVHAIDRPDLCKTFKSFAQMQRWFTEHAAGAKGGKRLD